MSLQGMQALGFLSCVSHAIYSLTRRAISFRN